MSASATQPAPNARGITIQVVLPRDVYAELLCHLGESTVSQWVRTAITREISRRRRRENG